MEGGGSWGSTSGGAGGRIGVGIGVDVVGLNTLGSIIRGVAPGATGQGGLGESFTIVGWGMGGVGVAAATSFEF